jgi:hypothetical protein
MTTTTTTATQRRSSSQAQAAIYAEIQRLTSEGRHREAERLLWSLQEPVTPYQLNSARALAAIRSGLRECKQAVREILDGGADVAEV